MNIKNIVIAATAAALSSSAFAADIQLKMSNVASDEGHLVIRTFDAAHAEGFPTGEPLREDRIKALAGDVEFVISGVDAGTYAIGVYHDIDDSGELETNMIGAPKEPVANTGKKAILVPKFDPSSFEVTDGVVEVIAPF
jgi:uncharacterized protein (DUF2141 family)